MEYRELEDAIRSEARSLAGDDREWTSKQVSERLEKIADQLEAIRREGQGGIDASMGKRSGGWKVEI